MLMSAKLKGCVTWFIYFLDLLWVRYNCAKFHRCRICVTDFREGGLFAPSPIREQPWKSPFWIGLTQLWNLGPIWAKLMQPYVPDNYVSWFTLWKFWNLVWWGTTGQSNISQFTKKISFLGKGNLGQTWAKFM